MDLIKVEPDVDYEIPQTDPISNMKDEEECIIPFIKTEAREIDFEWEPESENVGDEKNPPDYESDGETHQTSPTSDAKKEEGRRTVNCREMKSEVKEEIITVKEEWNDTKILEPGAQLNRLHHSYEINRNSTLMGMKKVLGQKKI
ncbi:uncharacterized protein [Periplaneta americana]|uniref:uncharacterized protein isoform X1 n=1 Tax=Periplaneta americana TaxID=6978 RepID=UPI0037E8A244